MKITTNPVSKRVFNPYTITITVETQQEHNDMYSMFSYYPTLPNEVTDNPETHRRLQEINRMIYDIVDAQDQY
jgi:hypothetical protein